MASQIPVGDTPTSGPAFGKRNPYELRFDLLHLAKDILEQNAHMAREDKAKDRKTFFTTGEVVETAQELYTFVQSK
tara:strand:- start:947 stop:1174 length:228 start_codon:yes stop_codon:yes gene_type:complete